MPARKTDAPDRCQNLERKIMKTRTTSSILIALLLAFLTLGVTKAQAFVINWRPVGITFGQTARVTSANTGTTAIIINGVFLDSEGTVLAQFDRQVIEPGKMMSFDFVWGESNRIQIRVVISGDTLKGLLTSTEVFENDTGKTTVFVGDPNI